MLDGDYKLSVFETRHLQIKSLLVNPDTSGRQKVADLRKNCKRASRLVI
jgi:hypothetical protein